MYYHQASTPKYLQSRYFNSETVTHFLPTCSLMHQLRLVSEASSHIWHLINLHRAAIALAASSLCSTHRPSLAGRPWLFSYLANRWRRCACSRGRRAADSCTPSARQMRQDLVDHEPILNTVVRHSDNDPGRAVLIGPTEPAAHKHCRYWISAYLSNKGIIDAYGTLRLLIPAWDHAVLRDQM